MYGDRIIGLTGTLGSEKEENSLSKLYENILIARIPTEKVNITFEYPYSVQTNEEDWISYIGESCK